MKSAFSAKVIDNNMIILDKLTLDDYKTRDIVDMLSAVNANKKTLLVLPEVDKKIIFSARNIPGVKTAQVNTLNVYDILNYDSLIVVRDAVSKLRRCMLKW